MPTRLLVIDLPNIAMRCAFGGQRPVSQSTPTTMAMLARHVRWAEPTHLVCAMDGDGPSFRKQLDARYKEARTVETRPYVGAAQAECERRGWACVSVAGYEADDLLGTYAEAPFDEVWLLTGDSDAFALVRDPQPDPAADPRPHASAAWPRLGNTVRVVIPANAQATPVLVDVAHVCRSYQLAAPWQVSHHKALMSELGDGVRGVPGIGEKRAAELLRAHGTIEAIIAAGAQESATRLERLVATHAETARLAYRLVELVRDVPLPPEYQAESARLRVGATRVTEAAAPTSGRRAAAPPAPAPQLALF